MKRLLLLAMITCGFGQVHWEIEKVDTVLFGADEYYCNAMTLKADSIPCFAYNDRGDFTKLEYAIRVDSLWQKETIDSGCKYYGVSLIADDDNTVHLSYCSRDIVLNTTYLCYGRCEAGVWQIELVDSMYGSLGNYWWYFNTSIDLDTAGLPAIAYIAWNLEDSLHYVKYAHYNGATWDTSVVRYDLSWNDPYPSDKSPSMKFNKANVPYIAFHKLAECDTIHLAYYDDSLFEWIVNPVVNESYGGTPVSLAFNSQDYPCIAHGYGPSLAYTWWDGAAWHTDSGIASIGWLELRIALALDYYDRPHILYRFWGRQCPYHCYKDTLWHMCGSVEPETLDMSIEADVSLIFDNNNQPHIGYKTAVEESMIVVQSLRYAKGSITGVEEEPPETITAGDAIHIAPNPFAKTTTINLSIGHPDRMKISSYGTSRRECMDLKIYDISGRLVKSFLLPTTYSLLPTVFWDGSDNDGQPLSNGVYFVRIETQGSQIVEKVVLLR